MVLSSPASHGLTPELVARFTAAQKRFQTSSGESSTSAAMTPGGGTPEEVDGSPSRLTALGEASDELLERLARLATTEPPAGRPPLETYTTTATAHGDVYRATDEFRRFMRSRYPGYGVGDHSSVRTPGSVAASLGGEPAPKGKLDSFLAP
jgi:hypothetical protein